MRTHLSSLSHRLATIPYVRQAPSKKDSQQSDHQNQGCVAAIDDDRLVSAAYHLNLRLEATAFARCSVTAAGAASIVERDGRTKLSLRCNVPTTWRVGGRDLRYIIRL